jgi:putative endonuclease
MHEGYYYTYIMASRSHTLYIGMTGRLSTRVFQHKRKLYPGFSATYNCNRLVFFERFSQVTNAIAREKQLKGWSRSKKIALIEKANPAWSDLSDGWYTAEQLEWEPKYL